jgi:ribosomal protein L17
LNAGIRQVPINNNVDLKAIIETAREQIRQLTKQRKETSNRIRTIKSVIQGLVSLYGDDLLSEELHHILAQKHKNRNAGFTDACRTALRQADKALSTREVCSLLQQRYPNVLRHNNNLVTAVNTILHRLVKYGEARTFNSSNGCRVWQIVHRNASLS